MIMYIEEYGYERIKDEVVKFLRNLGLKSKVPLLKTAIMNQHNEREKRLFGISLNKLEKVDVYLPQSNEQVSVPEFLIRTCSCIEANLSTEGLFRKAGSAIRQKNIKAHLDKGGQYNESHHVIDVANILKMFLRELPEPLIPYKYHDAFLRCTLLKEKKDEAVVLTCLLLPAEHLNSLAFLMTFLSRVAAHSEINKMTISNLAIIIAPSVMPVSTQKVTPNSNQLINQHVQIIQVLIKNANLIGVVPEHILSGGESVVSPLQSSSGEGKLAKKVKQKRRSSSLTRVFSGLRKMVGRSSPNPDHRDSLSASVPNLPTANPHTPHIMSSSKKRKANAMGSAPLSSKKKCDIVKNLPQGTVLTDTPYKSYSNGRMKGLTPRIIVAEKQRKNKSSPQKTKRRFFTKINSDSGSSSQKQVKSLGGSSLKISRISLLGKSGRRKKSHQKEDTSPVSSGDSSSMMATVGSMEDLESISLSMNETPVSPEYVRVPKSEYEDIKKRVSNIECTLSHEIENIVGVSMSDNEITTGSTTFEEMPKETSSAADRVHDVYKRTLKESDRFNTPSTDELAKRLSQELRIRRNSDSRIIRSPSARKIVSIRRRSRDNSVSSSSGDFCGSESKQGLSPFYQGRSLRRGKPNTVYTGLPHPNFLTGSTEHSTSLEPDDKEDFGVLTRSKARRISSFHGVPNSKHIGAYNIEKQVHWEQGEKYFEDKKSTEDITVENRRASIAKLRCQNAGMVLAKAKLFDNNVREHSGPKKGAFKPVSKSFRHTGTKVRHERSSIRVKRPDRNFYHENTIS